MKRRYLSCSAPACGAVALVMSLLPACVGGPEKPRPPSLTQMVPGTLTLLAANFVDTNDNGYRDSANVAVYVFSADDSYKLAIPARGAFRFRLLDRANNVISEWAFTADGAAERLRSAAPGPGYAFTLSMNDASGDVTEAGEAELTVLFTPEPSPGREPMTPLRKRSNPLLVGATRVPAVPR